MSGVSTYRVVDPIDPRQLAKELTDAGAHGMNYSFDAMSEIEELTNSGPQTFTVTVDATQYRPRKVFEVTDINTGRSFRIPMPLTGPTLFYIYG